ncbi:hypothetical protein JCM17846_24950 [Iodidimonas nitroreducens]|uniref:Uncharacterized protein n=1 Tax=Iodidimonas nitroreducens TaxID=1236968 RepID=A0A5A7N8Y7_9PROT|nr:hypothetical protein JCM17846_24950 [Iodidimonas nitroreducens]
MQSAQDGPQKIMWMKGKNTHDPIDIGKKSPASRQAGVKAGYSGPDRYPRG